MKKVKYFITGLICALSFNVVAVPEMIRLEEVIEASPLNLVLDASLNGHVIGALCDTCEKVRVVVTPDTVAFANGVPVPLIEAKKRNGKAAFVTYDVKTRKVIKIRW